MTVQLFFYPSKKWKKYFCKKNKIPSYSLLVSIFEQYSDKRSNKITTIYYTHSCQNLDNIKSKHSSMVWHTKAKLLQKPYQLFSFKIVILVETKNVFFILRNLSNKNFEEILLIKQDFF